MIRLLNTKEKGLCGSLCHLCASVVNLFSSSFTTETQSITEFAQRNAFSDRLLRRLTRTRKAKGLARAFVYRGHTTSPHPTHTSFSSEATFFITFAQVSRPKCKLDDCSAEVIKSTKFLRVVRPTRQIVAVRKDLQNASE